MYRLDTIDFLRADWGTTHVISARFKSPRKDAEPRNLAVSIPMQIDNDKPIAGPDPELLVAMLRKLADKIEEDLVND